MSNNNINLPNLNTEAFAEFYGIMLGDGCVYSNLSGICISGDSVLDEEYHKLRLTKLISFLYGVYPKIYYSKNQQSIRTIIYSKELAQFFKDINFPVGLKKNKLKIPYFFFEEKELLRSFIRGLFDTDGTIYHHPGAKAIIEISITNLELLDLIKKAITLLGLDIKISTNRVYASGRERVTLFFEEIQPSNPRHTLKYLCLINNKKVPSSKEIESYLKERRNNDSITGQ